MRRSKGEEGKRERGGGGGEREGGRELEDNNISKQPN